ncbi:MAG: MtrB/PioB family outer membrane beta-barrel protein, partial [Plesiomonas shigelloides]
RMNSHFTPRFSLLSLAIGVVFMVPLTANSAGYALKDANRSTLKKAAWVCKGCTIEAKKDGFAEATIAVQQGNDKHIRNTTGTDADGVAGNLSGGYMERDQDATRTEFSANRLGFDDGNAAFTLSSPGFYKISAKYRELSRFNSTGMTPYISQGDELILPPDWRFAGTTAGMTGLDNVMPVDLQHKRHRYEMEGKVAGEQFTTDLNFRHETRKGNTRSAVDLLTNAAMIAKPIDDATDTVDARVFWHGNNLLAGLTGQASKYYNDFSKLAFENPFTPTFGAAYDGQMSVAPDNQALSIGGDVQLFQGRQQALVHLRYSRMSQDEALLPATINGPSPLLPVSAVDTQIDVTEMIL